jgi:hypothetical protein
LPRSSTGSSENSSVIAAPFQPAAKDPARGGLT